jgi:sugar phosphate isomerase/epimerase
MTLSRRNFIAKSLGAAALLPAWDSFAQPTQEKSSEGYSLLIFATNWGFTGNWDDFGKKIKDAGYDGMEVWYPTETKSRDELMGALRKYSLKVGFLVGGSDSNSTIHFKQFQTALESAVSAKPQYVNCHSGKDYFDFEQNKPFMELTQSISATSGIPIYHETHRGRILYAAPVAKQFMAAFTKLRLTLDISHWCNVHESLLADQAEVVSMALSRTDHIHARIGHPEGPQVSDPRAPEWKNAVEAHFKWWDEVAAVKKQEGKLLTMLTEFGPPDYLPTLPYTRQPVANQWDINVYMLNLLRKRYS